MNNLIFLDYDGVVNIPIFEPESEHSRFYYPKDNKVNHYQACRWLSLLCLETNSSIVVTSTWRKWENYEECLRNGGLLPEVNILDAVPILNFDCATRGKEIKQWMHDNTYEFDKFVIIDDEDDLEFEDLKSRLVLCKTMVGFTYYEYIQAKQMLI